MKNVDDWNEAESHERRPEQGTGGGPAELISAIFKDPSGEMARHWTLARIQARWPEMAGNLSRHSRPDRIAGTRLVVRVTHDVYSQEFFLFRADIVERLRKLGITGIHEIQVEKGKVRFAGTPVRASESGISGPNQEIEPEVKPVVREFLDKLKEL